MGKFNKPSKGNISVLGTMIFFVVLGTLFTIIAFHDKMGKWLDKYGLTLCVVLIPVILFVVHQFVIKKIKEM